MRIAVVGKKYPFCGIVTYCREQVRALRAEGHTVAFYYLHNEEVEEELEDGLPYLLKTHMFTVPTFDAKTRLAERLREFKPDVVHASYALSPMDWALPELCDTLGVPLVATFHVALDHRPTFPNRVSRLVYRMYASTLARCQRVIVFSEAQKERMVHLGVPERVVTILPNGVDIKRYKPGPSRFRAEIGADHLISYMGRLDPEKNVSSLLKAFSELDAPPNTHLAVLGDGILANKLHRTYGDLPNVHWLGFIENERERVDILRGSEIFVLPSSVEGLSIALLEAMACGAVPVATDVGADGEVIEGVGRVLDPTHLDEQLVPAISGLLADPVQLAELRQQTRQRIVSRYAFSQNIERLVGIYEEVRAERWPLAH